jgi:hypothetical protein
MLFCLTMGELAEQENTRAISCVLAIILFLV